MQPPSVNNLALLFMLSVRIKSTVLSVIMMSIIMCNFIVHSFIMPRIDIVLTKLLQRHFDLKIKLLKKCFLLLFVIGKPDLQWIIQLWTERGDILKGL